MRLTVIGCAGSVPRPDSAASCYLVSAGGVELVLDLGNGALGPLAAAIDPINVSAVFITHLHPDHWADLSALCVLLRHGPVRRPPLPVYGPRGLAQRVAAANTGDPKADLSDVFTFVTLRPGAAVEVGDVRVTAAEVAHPAPAYGLRVQSGDRVLAYSGDSDECEALVALARDAHLALFEASFIDPAPQEPALPPGLHMTGTMAGRVARRAAAAALMLTHTVHWNAVSGAHDRELKAAASQFDGPISLAAPGLVVEV